MRFVRRLIESVERGGERPFLIDAQTGQTLSFAETHERAMAVAAALRERGLRRGDRLAVAMPNGADLALVYIASLYAGLVVVPIGSGFGARELRSILQRSRPALALAGGHPRLADAAAQVGVPVDELDVGAGPEPGDTGWEPWDDVGSGDVVAIHFTSGTTGPPRGVGHRLRDFVANALRYGEATGVGAEHRFYSVLPMTYMAGYYNLLLLPLTLGGSVVIDRPFDARTLMSFWEAPRRHDANSIWFVPTIMAMLEKLDRDPAGADWCREHVRFAAVGTAPLAPDLRERFEARYGVPVHESYGLSETLLATTSTPSRPAARGSVGAPLPGVGVRVREEDNAILIASPEMMVGYLGDGDEPTFQAPLVDDRWLETGDIGALDDSGELRITGRTKEVIIRGGVNVSPVEVERALAGEAGVESVAVIGIPHELLGEQIAAVVVCSDGASIDQLEPALKARASEALEPAQRPDAYVQIDDLPATPTGKVRRGALRDLVIDRLGLSPGDKGFAVDPGPTADSSPGPRGRVVDLSHALHEGMTTFPSPNHPRLEVTQLARHHIEGRATRRMVIGTHTGTHVDAPLHFIPDGAAADTLALDALVGPARVADLTPVEPLEEIGVDRLRAACGKSLTTPRVLLRFDWSDRFGALEFYTGSPYLSSDACEWLLDQGVRLLGMDSPSPDDPRLGQGSEDDSPNHFRLLGAGVVLLEYLTALRELRSPEVFLAALPLKVAGADGSPARVVAFDSG